MVTFARNKAKRDSDQKYLRILKPDFVKKIDFTKNLPLMKSNDWKERLNIVYSTNPDFKYDNGDEPEAETLPKQQQKLRVSIEKKEEAENGYGN